jgi:hypothetical protein
MTPPRRAARGRTRSSAVTPYRPSHIDWTDPRRDREVVLRIVEVQVGRLLLVGPDQRATGTGAAGRVSSVGSSPSCHPSVLGRLLGRVSAVAVSSPVVASSVRSVPSAIAVASSSPPHAAATSDRPTASRGEPLATPRVDHVGPPHWTWEGGVWSAPGQSLGVFTPQVAHGAGKPDMSSPTMAGRSNASSLCTER